MQNSHTEKLNNPIILYKKQIPTAIGLIGSRDYCIMTGTCPVSTNIISVTRTAVRVSTHTTEHHTVDNKYQG